MIQEFSVNVTTNVLVRLDASKFTDQFLEAFRQSFYALHSTRDHAEHLAQLAAREIITETEYFPDQFVEGYGPLSDMGVEIDVRDMEIETE